MFLPIKLETLHENQLNCLIVEGKMIRNFGSWKRHEERTLTFDFENGTVIEYDDEGKVLAKADLELRVK